MIRISRASEIGGRALLHFGVGPLSWLGGVLALAHAKILDNMEIGHNVMHGQYDWTGDPALNSQNLNGTSPVTASNGATATTSRTTPTPTSWARTATWAIRCCA
jgi:hypothetical protein